MRNLKVKIANRKSRNGFTLVEVLIAATLSLVLIGLVVQIFATVGATASETRSVIQTTDRLRSARILMQADLSNTTAEMLPLKIDRADGYFEYIEGPSGPIFPGLGASPIAVAFDVNQTDASGAAVADSTVGDPDDILMFTAQAPTGSYFHGRTRSASTVVDTTGNHWLIPNDSMAQASQAEICYFMRGDTLYRRVLLINPTVGNNGVIDPTIFLCSQYPYSLANPGTYYVMPPPPSSTTNVWTSNSTPPQPVWDIAFYDKFDVSAHQEGGIFDHTTNAGGIQPPKLVANTLADLAKRQNRYAHQPWVYPFDVRFWDTRQWTNPATNVAGGFLGLPTLRECTCYLGGISAGSGMAVWPFPLYDSPANTVQPAPLPVAWPAGVTVGAAVQNLWGSPQPSNMPMLPYNLVPLIYPYPTATYAATYQPNTDIPASSTGRMLLTAANGGLFDLWRNPYPLDQQDPLTGAIYAFSSAYQPPNWVNVNFSTRYADDVLLTHVLSFDVKAWDPTAPTIQTNATFGGMPPGTYMPGDPGYLQIINAWASSGAQTLVQNLRPATAATPGFTVAQGAYVDLNYLGAVIQPFLAAGNTQMSGALSNVSIFAGPGIAEFSSGLGMLYDTGSFTYEDDGIDQNQNGIIDDFTNGIDDNGIGGVDDLTELEGPIPYPVALKGIQIKIRVYDPGSRQIREVTLTQDFLGE